jgi:hypothetical protein
MQKLSGSGAFDRMTSRGAIIRIHKEVDRPGTASTVDSAFLFELRLETESMLVNHALETTDKPV